MNNHDKLVQYIKRGRQKGFAVDFLRQSLIEHGYHTKEVNRAISHATGNPQKEQARQRVKILLGATSIIAVVLLVILILSYSNQQKQIGVLSDQVQLTHEAAQAYLDELDTINLDIEEREKRIEQKITLLKQAEQSPQIQDLVKELEQLHQSIKTERKETRNLLWELLTAIIDRGPEQPDIISPN